MSALSPDQLFSPRLTLGSSLPSLICFRNTDSTTAFGKQSQKGRRKTPDCCAYLRLHSARQGEHLWALGTLPASRNCFLSSAQRKGLSPFIFSLFPVAFLPVSPLLLPETKMASAPDSWLRRHVPRKTRGYGISTSGASDCLHVHPPTPHPTPRQRSASSGYDFTLGLF